MTSPTEVAAEKKVRTLVINWWSFASDETASDETKEVFGEDGGHAGWNETIMNPQNWTGS